MSAIADIIVNQSSPANLQLSQNIKDSQPLNSTSSFADVLNQYINSEKEVNSEEKQTEQVSKTENEVSEPAVNEKDSSKTEKTEEKSEEKVGVKETSEKSENKETGNIKGAEHSVKNNNTDKVAEKSEKVEKVSNEKILKSEKKSEDVEKENLQYFEEYTASLMNKNVSENKVSKNEETESEIKVELNSKTELPVENQIPVIETSKESENEMDFSDMLKNESKTAKNELKVEKENKITVQDLRTKPAEESVKEEPKLKTQVKFTNDSTATITMNYAEETVQADVLSLNNQTAAADGSTFQSMLNNQIQANVPEFVKAGNIILKDNNQGTINLILHPDDLGNVKIHLNVDGKTLTGHITVATKEALQVFKDNSETLREAFIKNGFDSASFEVSYGNSGSQNQNFAFEQQNDGTNIVGKHMYGALAGASEVQTTENSEISESFGNYSVNIVA